MEGYEDGMDSESGSEGESSDDEIRPSNLANDIHSLKIVALTNTKGNLELPHSPRLDLDIELDFTGLDDLCPWNSEATTPLTFSAPSKIKRQEELENSSPNENISDNWTIDTTELEMSPRDAGPTTAELLETCQLFMNQKMMEVSEEGKIILRMNTSQFNRHPSIRFFSPLEAPQDVNEQLLSISDDDIDRLVYYRIWRAPVHEMLVQILQRSGLKPTKKNNWNLMWGARMKDEDYLQLNPFQKINHFPGTWNLGRKDCLFKNLIRMKRINNSEDYNFVPHTLFLPADRAQLEQALALNTDTSRTTKDKEHLVFIMKPPASACGKGIYLIDDIESLEEEIEEGTLAQRYIPNPLLINGTKFDLRLYVVMTGIDPLRLYIYDEGLARFATEKYSLDNDNLDNRFVHLTNYSVNRKSSGFEANVDADMDSSGSKWSLSALRRVMEKSGIPWTKVWASITDVVIRCILSVESTVNSKVTQFVKYRNTCFELFGMDMLIDDKLQVYLLEVNPMPSLHTSTPLDLKIKSQLMANLLQLIGLEWFDRKIYNEHSEASRKVRLLGFQSTSVPDIVACETNNPPVTHKKRCHVDSLWKPDFLNYVDQDDLQVIMDYMDERSRCNDFQRIYPTPDSETRYGTVRETPKWFDVLLCRWEQALHSDKETSFMTWLTTPTTPVPLLNNGIRAPTYKTVAPNDNINGSDMNPKNKTKPHRPSRIPKSKPRPTSATKSPTKTITSDTTTNADQIDNPLNTESADNTLEPVATEIIEQDSEPPSADSVIEEIPTRVNNAERVKWADDLCRSQTPPPPNKNTNVSFAQFVGRPLPLPQLQKVPPKSKLHESPRNSPPAHNDIGAKWRNGDVISLLPRKTVTAPTALRSEPAPLRRTHSLASKVHGISDPVPIRMLTLDLGDMFPPGTRKK